MFSVLHAVQNHEESWIFAEPVNDEIAPGYYDVIDVRHTHVAYMTRYRSFTYNVSLCFVQDPMDLSKIENKLESNVYKSVAQFEADFQLMWDNCAEFNGDDSGTIIPLPSSLQQPTSIAR